MIQGIYLIKNDDSSAAEIEFLLVVFRLKRLGLPFKECKEMQPSMNFNDMFKREHFSVIEEIVQKITASENDSLKTGLKVGLKYLIPNAANMIQGF